MQPGGIAQLTEEALRAFGVRHLGGDVAPSLGCDRTCHQRHRQRSAVVEPLEHRLRPGGGLLATVEVALPPSDLRLGEQCPGSKSLVGALGSGQHVPQPAEPLGQVAAARPVEEPGGRCQAQLEDDVNVVARPGEGGTNVVVLLVFRLPGTDQPPGEPLVRPACEPICVPARMPRAELVHDALDARAALVA